MKVTILFILLSLTLSGISHAATDKERYELQERCGKRAEEASKGAKQIEKEGYTEHHNAKFHYNKKLNKCLSLLTTTIVPKNKKESGSKSKALVDAYEEGGYGKFFQRKVDNRPFLCEVSGKICNSEKEWDSLVKPYVEE